MTGVTCDAIGEQIDLYLDDQMTKTEAETFKKHLALCKPCAALLANRAALRKRMRTVARDVEIPRELGDRIRFSVSQEAAKGYRTSVPYGRSLLAIAAAAVMAAAGFYYWPAQDARPVHEETQAEFIARVAKPLPPVMRVGLTQHVHCGVFREYPPIAPKLIDMAREQGLSPALINAVETNTPQGCHVVMAHQCSYNGRTYTHVIARGDNRLMSLLITQRVNGEGFDNALKSVATVVNTPIFAAASDRYSVDAFETPEYLVYLVSDFDAAENLQALKAMTPGLRAALL
jgi:hypothetical protein